MSPLIIDTNVVVAGLIGGNRAAPPAVLLDAMLHGAFPFLLSIDLLAEYRAVLLRAPLAARHGLDEEQVDHLLGALAFHGIVRHPAPADPARLPDPGDAHLLALLDGDERAVLVTGDRALRDSPPCRGRAVSPAEAVAALQRP